MRNDKRQRMMHYYGGFNGPEMVRNITTDIQGTDLAITMRPNNTFIVCKGQGGEEKIYSQEHTKHTI